MIILGDLTELEEGVINLLTFEKEINEAIGERLEGTEIATKNIAKLNEEGEVELRLAAQHESTGIGIDSFTITLTVEQIKNGDFPDVEEVAERRVEGVKDWI